MAYCTTDWYVSNRVGIGTDTPPSRLTIAPATNGTDSSIEFTNADNAVISAFYSQTFTVNNSFTQSGRSFVFANGGKGYANNCLILMTIQADTSNVDVRNGGVFSVLRSGNDRKGCLFADGSGTKLSSDVTGNDPLFLIAPGASAQIRMCAGGNTTMAIGPSNVGIGTIAPSYRLHVCRTGNSDWLSSFENTDGTESVSTYISHGNGYGIAIDSTENDSKYIFKAMAGTGGGGGKGSVPIIWAQHDGNVGINTSSPALHNGRGLVVSGVAGGRGIMEIWDGTSGKSVFQNVGGDTYIGQLCKGSGNGDLFLLTGGSGTSATVSMTVKCAGNVGIGCTSPGAKLTVGGTLTTTDTITTTSGTVNTIVSWNASVGIIGTDTNHGLQIRTCGTERIRVTCAGTVGINTSSPSYQLHVNGTFYAAGSSIKYKEGICNYDTNSCLFMCLKPVTYQYKDEFKHLGKELKSETQIGLIAEEVAEVMPELAILVNEEDEKVVRNVDYEKLSIILLSEVQKLRKEVDQLKQSC